MTIDFLNVVVTVLTLIVLAVPGYLLAKAKFLPEKASEAFSNLVLYGCQPVLVFMSFQGKEYSSLIGLNMLIVAGVSTLVHFIMTGIVYLCIRNKNQEAKMRCVRYGAVFSNCGYMGLPMIQSLFAGKAYLDEAIIYVAVVLAVFNILNWTLGIYLATGDKKQISIKKVLLNPTIIGIVIGFVVFITVKIPLVNLAPDGSQLDMVVEKIMSSLSLIGDTVTPLSLTVIGLRLANVNFKQLFLDKWAYVTCFLKLVVMSIVVVLLCAFLPISGVAKYTLFFVYSMPCATSTTLFAIKFGGDGDSAAVIVLLTTVLSILTIPLMFLIFSSVFGIVV